MSGTTQTMQSSHLQYTRENVLTLLLAALCMFSGFLFLGKKNFTKAKEIEPGKFKNIIKIVLVTARLFLKKILWRIGTSYSDVQYTTANITWRCKLWKSRPVLVTLNTHRRVE